MTAADALRSLRAEVYEVASSLRALAARSDARERGVSHSEVECVAMKLEHAADEAGKEGGTGNEEELYEEGEVTWRATQTKSSMRW